MCVCANCNPGIVVGVATVKIWLLLLGVLVVYLGVTGKYKNVAQVLAR